MDVCYTDGHGPFELLHRLFIQLGVIPLHPTAPIVTHGYDHVHASDDVHANAHDYAQPPAAPHA